MLLSPSMSLPKTKNVCVCCILMKRVVKLKSVETRYFNYERVASQIPLGQSKQGRWTGRVARMKDMRTP